MMSSELEALRLAYHMWCSFLQLFLFYLLCLCIRHALQWLRLDQEAQQQQQQQKKRLFVFASQLYSIYLILSNFVQVDLDSWLLEVSTSLANHRTSVDDARYWQTCLHSVWKPLQKFHNITRPNNIEQFYFQREKIRNYNFARAKIRLEFRYCTFLVSTILNFPGFFSGESGARQKCGKFKIV